LPVKNDKVEKIQAKTAHYFGDSVCACSGFRIFEPQILGGCGWSYSETNYSW
jgi:hypothetical protein